MTKRFPPAAGSLLYLSWMMLIAPSCSQNAPAQTCDPGWFGSNCQYKCRYLSWILDRDTTCSYSDCEAGWFGPGCQYVDLSYNQFTLNVRSWHYDNDGGLTCEQKNELKQLTVNMPSEFGFTWLRLQVSDPSLLHAFQVTFSDNINKKTLACENVRNATVNKKTLDIHCDLDVLVKSVVLTGDGVKSLCSLHVSGGRNVALRQSATQSSNNSFGDRHLINYSIATNAVDGNTNNYFYDKSCTHTSFEDTNPNWSVKLSSANYITRYVVYNRLNSYGRLHRFTLTSFTKDHKIVVTFTDTSFLSLNVYTITNGQKSPPVSEVNIRPNHNVSDPILSLCEVELYGDTSCPPSRYGRECEHTCNCAVKDESCFVSTGGCPSGCADGFQGESCDKSCDFGKYGLGCNSTCSQFCVPTSNSRSPCFPTNGTCVHGCVSGYNGSQCENIRILMDNDSIPVAVVVYPSIAALFLVVVVVLGVILWRRHRSTSLKQLSNVVNNDHYDEIPDTELKQTSTTERNEHKPRSMVNRAATHKKPTHKQPTHKQPTHKQPTQVITTGNNSLTNVISNNGDLLPYEETNSTEQKHIFKPERNEPKYKTPVILSTAPKHDTGNTTSHNNPHRNVISNINDKTPIEEINNTELKLNPTPDRNESKYKTLVNLPTRSQQPTQSIVIPDKSDTVSTTTPKLESDLHSLNREL